ncbi:MAG: hypothetical protein U0793_26475 [Gemmataceae bacterium]
MAEPSVQELAAFQAALLDLLSQDLAVEEVRQRLRSDAVFAPFQEYLEEAAPRMLEVALELTKKWGRQ